MRKLVTIEQVKEKKPIEGADLIEAVRVRQWWVVAKKDEFQIGDNCVYFEVDSLLPVKEEYEFLRKSSYINRDGQEGFRLKTIKLKGQISQGLVIPVPVNLKEFTIGTEVTSELGVVKYEPPVNMNGDIISLFDNRIQKTDEERIQNIEISTLSQTSNLIASEKLEGTSCTIKNIDGEFGVYGKNCEFAETADNAYWEMVRRYDLKTKLPKLGNIAVQGELVGSGIQGNIYKLKNVDMFIFSMLKNVDMFIFSIQNIDTGTYMTYEEMEDVASKLGMNMVPVIDRNFTLPDNVEELLAYADGYSALNPQVRREGVVIRNNDKTVSFKVISNKYLLNEK